MLFSGILGSITTSHIDGKFSILHLTDEQVASASDLYEVEDPADQLWTRRCPSTRRQTSAVDGADVVEMCEDSSGIEIDARMCSPLMAAELEAASCTVCCKAYDEVRRERAVLAKALLQRERAKHFQQRLMALYAGSSLPPVCLLLRTHPSVAQEEDCSTSVSRKEISASSSLTPSRSTLPLQRFFAATPSTPPRCASFLDFSSLLPFSPASYHC